MNGRKVTIAGVLCFPFLLAFPGAASGQDCWQIVFDPEHYPCPCACAQAPMGMMHCQEVSCNQCELSGEPCGDYKERVIAAGTSQALRGVYLEDSRAADVAEENEVANPGALVELMDYPQDRTRVVRDCRGAVVTRRYTTETIDKIRAATGTLVI
jgi:hypothetical protein